MFRYILKRVLWMIPTMVGIILLLFMLNYVLRDNPLGALQRSNYSGTDYRSEEHADDELPEVLLREFGAYCINIATKLDFGKTSSNMPVMQHLAPRYKVTLQLSLYATLLATVIAVPLGIYSATRRGRFVDYMCTTISLFGASVPSFWLAMMMIILFCLRLNWLSAWGIHQWSDWIMPVVSLGLAPVANIVRMTRSSMLEVIRQDYVRTAHSKGLSGRRVISHHCVRNAIIPVITVIGTQVGSILGSTIIVEAIFSITGIGMTLNTAINGSDWPLMMGCIILLCATVCVVNLIVDISYAFIDPRIHEQYRES